MLRRIVGPLESFFHSEAAGGLLIAIAAALALAAANSPWSSAWEALWATHVRVGAASLGLEKPLVVWVNDLLMAIFFLLVGLEIKREVLTGELSSRSQAVLPFLAALGGMLAPMGLFLLVAGHSDAARGWGIPMATDIAFALGVARLLGARVPAAMIVLLTALAVIDDLGAIAVIAVFYARDLAPQAHLAAAGITLALVAMNRGGVQRPVFYLLVGLPLWVAVLKSGVHATLAGVVIAMCVPARVKFSRQEVLEQARALLDAAEQGADEASTQDALAALERRLEESQSPAQRLERGLHALVAFAILPLFALANAGVSLRGVTLADLTAPATLGVGLGLLVGKPLGVVGAIWLAVRARIARLPEGLGWRHVLGLGALAGIGFTMSLFVAGLAWEEEGALHRQAKLGVMLASVASAVAAALLLSPRPAPGQPDAR